MFGFETHMLLKHYLAQGLSRAAIAERLGTCERTIRRWINDGELERDPDEPPRYRPRAPKPTKLDPFKPIIMARLEAYPELSAVRLLEEIQADGYTGGYSQLRDYVRQVRPRPAPAPVVRFETPPGRQGQVDFARFTFPWGVRYALLVVLGYSRLLWLCFYERQDMRTLFRGLEAAFTYFGGVPHELLFDQMKAVITADLRLLGGQLVLNEEFIRFAAHWSFRPRACRPYRAQTKGKVERPISYVRRNFVYGRELLGDGHLAEQCARWLERANGRVHATTKERPRERFERDERAVLLALAEQPYRSLVLGPPPGRVTPPATPPATPLVMAPAIPSIAPFVVPHVAVERRPLSVYATAVGAATYGQAAGHSGDGATISAVGAAAEPAAQGPPAPQQVRGTVPEAALQRAAPAGAAQGRGVL